MQGKKRKLAIALNICTLLPTYVNAHLLKFLPIKCTQDIKHSWKITRHSCKHIMDSSLFGRKYSAICLRNCMGPTNKLPKHTDPKLEQLARKKDLLAAREQQLSWSSDWNHQWLTIPATVTWTTCWSDALHSYWEERETSVMRTKIKKSRHRIKNEEKRWMRS